MADTTADSARFDTVTCDPQAPCAGFLVCPACAARGVTVPPGRPRLGRTRRGL
ncbi:hypothetical protein [Kitasatospora purpeofusca]|uniref:hypothetical protein n=1 Tax=Kitasatospora purpeofusca TaxID=67352 RepID=UPI003810B378